MNTYTLLFRKIFHGASIVFGVLVIMFVLFHVVGGDPAYLMLGNHATAERIAEIRHEYGLDLPMYQQFLAHIKQTVLLDFGHSYATRERISEMILRGTIPSLSITIPAFALTTFFALVISLFVVYSRSSFGTRRVGLWIDRLALFICIIGMSVPMLSMILFSQYYFAYKFQLFPVSGFDFNWPERIQYLILPVSIWVAMNIGYDFRYFRTSMMEELGRDYIIAARARGTSEFVIFSKHLLKNAMIPIITYVLVQIPFLFLGSLLLENFFQIPGLGNMAVEAIRSSDFPVIKALSLVLSLFFIAVNIVTDLLYKVVDPRIGLYDKV